MSIFEELMRGNRELTESLSTTKRKVAPKKRGAKVEGLKKISIKNIKFESLRIFEDADLDELDAKFAVEPEEAEAAEDEVVLVVDPELPADEEVPEDAAEDLVGDYVYKCPVCGSNYVCGCDAVETEAIEVDDEGVPTECPICGDDADQILVGEIAPVDEAGEETEMEPVDSDDAEKDEEEEEESEDEESSEGEEDVEDEESSEEEEVIEDSLKRGRGKGRRTESRKQVAELFGKKKTKQLSTDQQNALIKSWVEEFKTNEDARNQYWADDHYAEKVAKKEKIDLSVMSQILDSAWDKVPINLRNQARNAAKGESESVRRDVNELFGLGKKKDKSGGGKEKREKVDAMDIEEGDYIYTNSGAKQVSQIIKNHGYYIFFVDHNSRVVKNNGDVVSGSEFQKHREKNKDQDGDMGTYTAQTFGRKSDAPIVKIVYEGKTIKESDKCPECGKDPCECKKKSKKVVKESDECPECEDYSDDMSLELVDPVEEEDAPKVEVNAEKVELFLDDHKFESLMTKMVRENYKGTPIFKLRSATVKNGKLVLEYTVGNKRGTFLAEGFNKRSRVLSLKIRDKGQFTEAYTKTPSFVMECVRIRNKIIPTSLKYNFTKKVNESIYRVSGSVGSKRK